MEMYIIKNTWIGISTGNTLPQVSPNPQLPLSELTMYAFMEITIKLGIFQLK